MSVTHEFETGSDGVRRRLTKRDGRESQREAWSTPVLRLSADKAQAAADGLEVVTVTGQADAPDDQAAFAAELFVDDVGQPVQIASGSGQLELTSDTPATITVAVSKPRGLAPLVVQFV